MKPVSRRETIILHTTAGDLVVEVRRKEIKHLHLLVLPPAGAIRVTAPRLVSLATIREAVLSRLTWIERQRELIAEQEWPALPQYVSGETVLFQGQSYKMYVVEEAGRSRVTLSESHGARVLLLHVPPGSDPAARERVLYAWYRAQLQVAVPPLLARWEPRLGVRVGEWRIKHMRTRWGTCNSRARRIWLNLELIKKPWRHLEYVLVHEMVHILEPTHNARFQALLDEALPPWRALREELNAGTVPGAPWEYG